MITRFLGKFLLFCKVVAPKLFYNDFSVAHYEVESLLMSSAKMLNLILPRGMAKTTLMSVLYPLYLIFVHDHTTPKFIVIVSKTQGHAINCLTSIKDILEYGTEFRDIFGYHGKMKAQKWREDVVVLPNGSVIMAKGMGQPIRGLNYNGMRVTYLVLDDPEDENNTKTAEAMNNNMLWLLKGALPTLATKSGYERCVVIGTPIHQLCIVEQLAKTTNWTTKRYSYLLEDDTISLWPQTRTVQMLREEKASLEAMGRVSVFYAERMCQIIGDSTQLFKEEYFLYHNYELRIENSKHYLYDEFAPPDKIKIPVNVYMGIDPASSLSSRADYSTIVPIAIDKFENLYVLPYFRKRVQPHDLADAIELWYRKYQPVVTRIESIAYQEMLRQEIRRRTYIPGMEIKERPSQNKEMRLSSLQPRFVQGKVYLMTGQVEMKEEFITFPRSSHDDLMDGFYYAQKLNRTPDHDLPKEDNRKRNIYDELYDEDDGLDWSTV